MNRKFERTAFIKYEYSRFNFIKIPCGQFGCSVVDIHKIHTTK